MAEVNVGDIYQVWLDFPGYQGRIGTVINSDKRYHYLKLGDGVVIRVNFQSRTAQIPGSNRTHPLSYKLCKSGKKKIPMKRTKFNRFKRTKSV